MSSILAVGPHPDDVEIAAGGTVALLAAAGHTVVLLDLTRGERATRGNPETRAAEARAAASILGASAWSFPTPGSRPAIPSTWPGWWPRCAPTGRSWS